MNPPADGAAAVQAAAVPVERAVIDALQAARPGQNLQVAPDSAVLDLVDSLGLIMTLGNLQAALEVELTPKQVIELFRARTVADFAAVLARFVDHRPALQ